METERGTELFAMFFSPVTRPIPRKGMETPSSALSKTMNIDRYTTNSPQGDGNFINPSNSLVNLTNVTRPIPRKGMETAQSPQVRPAVVLSYTTNSP
jgi:hypothetical protein